MTAAAYSTNLADIFTDGNTTGWTAIGTGQSGINQETDYYIQGTSCISKNAFASSEKGMIYASGGDQGGSGTDGAYIAWITHLTPNSLDTIAGGGISFCVGSSNTAYEKYWIGGSDTIPFGGWILAAINEATAGDASAGSPSATVESHFGATFDLPSGGPTKGAPNAIDGIRFGRCDIVMTGGTAPDAACDFDGIFTNLETASLRYGLLVFQNGSYFNSGLMQLGGASAVRFTDSNKTVFLRDHPHVTANFHTWEVQHASSEVNLTNMIFQALGAQSKGRWITTDNADVNLDGCSFTDMNTFDFDTNTTVNACTFRRCGVITPAVSTFQNNLIDNCATVVVADLNELDKCTFIGDGTTAPGHAVDLGTVAGGTSGAPKTFVWDNTLDNGATNQSEWEGSTQVPTGGTQGDANDAILISVNAGTFVKISVASGATIPTVRNTGTGSLEITANEVTLTITVKDITDGAVIEDAMVYVTNTGETATYIDKVQTDVSGQVSYTASLGSAQTLAGSVRAATPAGNAYTKHYKSSPVAGDFSNTDDTNITIQMIPDE